MYIELYVITSVLAKLSTFTELLII